MKRKEGVCITRETKQARPRAGELPADPGRASFPALHQAAGYQQHRISNHSHSLLATNSFNSTCKKKYMISI